MAEKQLREPVAGPHQIAAGVLAGADEIARGLFFRPGHPHRRDLAESEQPRQPLGVSAVGLDPVGSRSDLRRRRDDATDPTLTTRTRKPVPGRSRLVHDPDRHRQRLQPRHRRITPRRHPQRPHLTARSIDHARDHRASVHSQVPTQLPSLMTGASALPPRLPRRQPAPTYVARRRHSIRSGAPRSPRCMGVSDSCDWGRRRVYTTRRSPIEQAIATTRSTRTRRALA